MTAPIALAQTPTILLSPLTALDILRCLCGRAKRHPGRCVGRSLGVAAKWCTYIEFFRMEMVPAIEEALSTYGYSVEREQAALVLIAGIFTRIPRRLRQMTGVPAHRIVELKKSLESQRLWNKNGVIINTDAKADDDMPNLDFYLLVMAANGEIEYSSENNAFRSKAFAG